MGVRNLQNPPVPIRGGGLKSAKVQKYNLPHHDKKWSLRAFRHFLYFHFLLDNVIHWFILICWYPNLYYKIVNIVSGSVREGECKTNF